MIKGERKLKGSSYYLVDDKIHLMEDSFSNENIVSIDQTDRNLLEGINFLVVDDNPINLTVADKTLAKFGGFSFKALNSQDAVELFESKSIQLILMDLHMPNVDGFQTTKLIRQTKKFIEKPVPILAYTTYSYNDVKEDLEAFGLGGYVGKPFTHAQVLDTIMQAVGVQR